MTPRRHDDDNDDDEDRAFVAEIFRRAAALPRDILVPAGIGAEGAPQPGEALVRGLSAVMTLARLRGDLDEADDDDEIALAAHFLTDWAESLICLYGALVGLFVPVRDARGVRWAERPYGDPDGSRAARIRDAVAGRFDAPRNGPVPPVLH
jgi:hypothetical protein